MIKKTILFLLIFNVYNCHSQDFELRITPSLESKIIYKDGTSEDGFLRLASSVFDLRLRDSEKGKEHKIDYKLIDRIIVGSPKKGQRIFQYRNNNYNKFKIFVELIYVDLLSIYVTSSNTVDLFYSDFDRLNAAEMMDEARSDANLDFISIKRRYKIADTLNLPNNKTLILPIGYSYYNNIKIAIFFGEVSTLKYYLSIKGNPKLYKVEKNKRFLKKAGDLVGDCKVLIRDLEQNNIDVEDLPRFIEYFKDVCF